MDRLTKEQRHKNMQAGSQQGHQNRNPPAQGTVARGHPLPQEF